MNNTYRKFLQSKRWNEIKQAYYKLYPRVCYICKIRKGIDLHHIKYGNIWAGELTDLVALCRNCHRDFHLLSPSERQYLYQYQPATIGFSENIASYTNQLNKKKEHLKFVKKIKVRLLKESAEKTKPKYQKIKRIKFKHLLALKKQGKMGVGNFFDSA